MAHLSGLYNEILVDQDAVLIPLDWNTRVTVAKPYVTRSFTSDYGYMEKWDVDMAAKNGT